MPNPRVALNKKKRSGQTGGADVRRDACYKLVKSRYRVWPSAYASGALVRCRKIGAKKWGLSQK